MKFLITILLISASIFCSGQKQTFKQAKQLDSTAQIMQSSGYLDEETYRSVQTILPKSNASKKVAQLPALKETDVIAFAKTLLQTILPKLDAANKSKLDELINDTATNVAGTGIVLLSAGFPKTLGSYLIIKDAILHPKNVWAVNDLGILFREKKQNDKASQCFLYAEKLNQESVAIKCNLAWASAYYGDFTTAKKYFNDVITARPNFSSALEGLSLMAYQQRNENALFDCLKKEVMVMATGGNGPSEILTNICGNIVANEEARNYETQDPFNNHTYDNNADVDDMNQDPPPVADDEPVKYPSIKPIFVNNPIDAMKISLGAELSNYQQKIMQLLKKNDDELKQAGSNMPLYKKPSYTDDQGNIISPYNYEKFIILFSQITQLYHWREDKIAKEYAKKTDPFITDVLQHDLDLSTAFGKAIGQCGDDECIKKVKCEFLPKFYSTASSDLNAAAIMWNKYFEKHVENFNWYIQATSPIFQRVHDQRWNKLLNIERQVDIRNGILSAYKDWSDLFPQTVNYFITPLLSEFLQSKETLDCKVEMGTMGGGPDPYSKKIKKLATFEEPCYKEERGFDIGFASYQDNCDHMKIAIGSPIVKFLFEHTYHKPNSKQDDYYIDGLQVSLKKSIGYEKEIEGWSASMEGEAGADLTFFSKYNSQWKPVEKGVDVDIEVTGKGEIKTGNEIVDNVNPLNFSKGVSVHFTVTALCGPDGSVGPYGISNVSGETH